MPENEQNVLVPEREPRITPVPDPAGESVLADAEELAYDALLSIAHHEEWIGEHAGYLIDGKRVLTHTWACERPGYRGWFWTSTVTRAPRSKKVTVDEVSLLPGEDALLSPKWIPWEVRLEVAEEEIKERRAAEEDEAADRPDDELSGRDDDSSADSGDSERNENGESAGNSGARSSRAGGARSGRERSGGSRSRDRQSAGGREHRRQRRRVRTVAPEAEGSSRGASGRTASAHNSSAHSSSARGNAASHGAGTGHGASAGHGAGSGHSASARAVRKRAASRAARGPVVRGSRRRTYEA